MEILVEIFPFAFGVLLGWTWARFGGPGSWRIPWAMATIAVGSFATFASGEWRASSLYFLFDIALVAFISFCTLHAFRYWQRRAQRG